MAYLVALECPDWLVHSQFTYMDELVVRARGKAHVSLPVHVQSGRLVEAELLLHISRGNVPHHCRLVNAARHYQGPLAVPL